jgi:hypothetical protein
LIVGDNCDYEFSDLGVEAVQVLAGHLGETGHRVGGRVSALNFVVGFFGGSRLVKHLLHALVEIFHGHLEVNLIGSNCGKRNSGCVYLDFFEALPEGGSQAFLDDPLQSVLDLLEFLLVEEEFG